jgi:predicted transcriptional regulator
MSISADPATQLRIWMAEHRIECKELASKLDCDRMSVSAWRLGRSRPRMVYRKAIERISDGRLPASAWGDGE